MYQAADVVHCLWMPISPVQGGQVVMCYAHALWDEVFLSSHYINFHRMGAPVCVCPLLCCTECVRQVFPGRAHYKVLVPPHTSCNGWSEPAGTAVPGSACDKVVRLSRCPCAGVLAHSCEKLLKYSVFSKSLTQEQPRCVGLTFTYLCPSLLGPLHKLKYI